MKQKTPEALHKAYKAALMAYIEAFCAKHETILQYWGVLGQIAFIADNHFSFSDIKHDIDTNQPKEHIWDWYEKYEDVWPEDKDSFYRQCSHCGSSYKKKGWINYKTYCMGFEAAIYEEKIIAVLKLWSEYSPYDKEDMWRGFDELNEATKIPIKLLKSAIKSLKEKGIVHKLPVYDAEYKPSGNGWFLTDDYKAEHKIL